MEPEAGSTLAWYNDLAVEFIRACSNTQVHRRAGRKSVWRYLATKEYTPAPSSTCAVECLPTREMDRLNVTPRTP